jgi:AcrR family transcriptional regulator
MIRAAGHILETEGLEAVRMPRVAELAGCARTLVYRYFPRREDLIFGVVSEFYERLNERLDVDAQTQGLQGLVDGQAGDATPPFIEAIWDVINEIGLGGVLLQSSHQLGIALKEYSAAELERFEKRWVDPLRAMGLSDTAASVVIASATGTIVELVRRSRRGEIARDEALALGHRALASLVSGLAAAERQAGRSKARRRSSKRSVNAPG